MNNIVSMDALNECEKSIVTSIMNYVHDNQKTLALDNARTECYRFEDGTVAVRYCMDKINFMISESDEKGVFDFIDLNGNTGMTESFSEYVELTA